MAHTGGCFCRQIRYSTDADPAGARTCWCRDCQYIASGSATNNVLFAEDAVSFTGDISEIEKIADSGNVIRRGFCSKCGTHLYSRTVEPKGAPIRIRAGTLDDPELISPKDVIWTSSAPSWAVIDENLPHYPKGPQ